jgi:FixJ family two-component response regulator
MPAEVETEIFVVDDDPAVRDALRLVLELEGYRVTAFPEGGSFLAAVRQRQPGCVVLDVHMPGRSGLEVLQELGPGFSAPVFMISGQGDIPMAVEAFKHG